MMMGVVLYFVYTSLPFLKGTSPIVNRAVALLQPALIFGMLFITFCKIKPRDLRLCRWHGTLLLVQVGAFALCAAVLILFPNLPGRLLLESAMTCFICPTACAAAVVCAKLGGHAAHLITYILLINLAAALFIPLIVPLVNPTEGQTFIATSMLIIRQVFPTLICPLLLAWGIRFTLPRLAQRLQNTGDTAFYLWTVALTMAIAVTTRSIMHSHVALPTGDAIAAGQAIGQKNTVFAIWMAYTFLTPITAIAGGFYSVWHNIFNSYQLYRKRKAA